MVEGLIPPGREAEIRERFTPERWQEFRRDTNYLVSGKTRGSYFKDHGNTGSPAWAMTASLFTENLPYNRASAHVFGSLDMLLLLILFVTVWRTFGERVLALTMIVGMSVPLVYTYLGGSILRMDWIFALGMSVCFFEQRRFRTAGVFLGYAVAAKLLAGVMVLPLGLRLLAEAIGERRVNRDHLRYVVFAVAGLVAFVLLAALYFTDMQLWPDYFERMLKTFRAKYYAHNHSFRDVFLQLVHHPWEAWKPLPESVAARDPDVFIQDVRGSFVVAQIVLFAGLCIVAVRNPVRVAFALGPLALFVLLVTNRYYWQVWMISALALAPTYRQDWRHTAFLAGIFCWLGAGHLLKLSSLDLDWKLGGYLGSYGLSWIGAALLCVELISWHRRRTTLNR
jgi:uncharacterized membrane protein